MKQIMLTPTKKYKTRGYNNNYYSVNKFYFIDYYKEYNERKKPELQIYRANYYRRNVDTLLIYYRERYYNKKNCEDNKTSETELNPNKRRIVDEIIVTFR